MLRLITAIRDKLSRNAIKRLDKLAHKLYPDTEDRAYALMCEGARLLEISEFYQGALVGMIQIEPKAEGKYEFVIYSPEEIEAEL